MGVITGAGDTDTGGEVPGFDETAVAGVNSLRIEHPVANTVNAIERINGLMK